MRLKNRSGKGQRPEAIVVDQTFNRRTRARRIALQLSNTGIVTRHSGIKEAVDSSRRGLSGAPGGETEMRKPRPAVANRPLHVSEAIEVIAIPNVKPSRTPALAADAEVRHLR